uniref:Uncharacterized protein n=1 Tax=Ascaris lumbricoides TaxID=6252 RepID=A0A9J2P9C9_ASCLU
MSLLRSSQSWQGKSLLQNIPRACTCSPMLTSCALTFVCLVVLPSNTQALTFFVGTTGIDSETDAQRISVPKKSKLTDDELSSVYNFCRLLPFMGHKDQWIPLFNIQQVALLPLLLSRKLRENFIPSPLVPLNHPEYCFGKGNIGIERNLQSSY